MFSPKIEIRTADFADFTDDKRVSFTARVADSSGVFRLPVFLYPRHPRNLRFRFQNPGKRKLLSGCALDHLQLLKNLEVKTRFDIVEVLLQDGMVHEIRHLPNTFSRSSPHRYG